MKVRTDFHPLPRGGKWTAIDEDERVQELLGGHKIGRGKTEQEAIKDLERQQRNNAADPDTQV
jgi:hypothetical protein